MGRPEGVTPELLQPVRLSSCPRSACAAGKSYHYMAETDKQRKGD